MVKESADEVSKEYYSVSCWCANKLNCKKKRVTGWERKGRETLSDARIKGSDVRVTAGAILRCREAFRKLPYGIDEIVQRDQDPHINERYAN